MTGPAPEIVIGSGPAGLAVALARLARGQRVLMLDGGRDLEPKNAARRAGLAARAPADWSEAERTAYTHPNTRTAPGHARRFGSDFAQEPLAATLDGAPDWFGLRASRAIGGLSNLWGAAVLPNRQADMAGWPIGAADLAPHYRAMSDVLGVSGDSTFDGLFPDAPMTGHAPLPPSPQTAALRARADGLTGVTLGPARVAASPACVACGLCLHGCPWGHIFSARDAVTRLVANEPRLAYRPGAVVRALTESGDSVTLNLDGGETLSARRVFVAAGVLETARIAFASHWAETLTIADSQHGFLPLLSRRAADPDAPRHTLAALFAELEAPDISPYLIHSQIYGYNEVYAPEMTARYGHLLPGFGKALFARLARHLVVAQSFLHSDHSHRIRLSPAADGRLHATLEENPDTPARLKAAQRRLARALRPAGLLALTPAAHGGPPGSSFHAGSTLPMGGITDSLGRPADLTRTHVVDASVLPAIAATTITFTVMANAHRIGTDAPA